MSTQFRRSGQRDERRRRVLLEETGDRHLPEKSSGASSKGASDRSKMARRYPVSTLSTRQPSLLALVPRRRWTLLVWCALLLSCIAGLQTLYGYVALGHASIVLAHVPAIDLASRASLASWFGSILLMASAGLGALTYLIRRHRLDDYRGTYRMWYWVIVVLILAAADQVAWIQESVRLVLLDLSGIAGYPDATLIWTACMAVLVLAIVVRLGIEMRECRTSLLWLVAALVCYGASAAGQLKWLWAGASIFRVMAQSALILGGHLFILLAIAFYACHVFRDASGLIGRAGRVKRATRKKVPVSAAKSKAPVRGTRRSAKPVHESPAKKAPSRRRHSADPPAEEPVVATLPIGRGKRSEPRKAVATESRQVADEGTVAGGSKLSKAERRRLRKQRRRDRPSQAA